MPRNPNGTCADCNNPMWLSVGCRPQGEARCLPCRRARPVHKDPKTRHQLTCEWCGECFSRASSKAKYCSTRCAAKADSVRKQIRPPHDVRVRRAQREASAPGISRRERTTLGMKWQKQGRACTYCGEPATTIDHVLPLVRGGTNYEGNLTPCCRRCNSSKAGFLASEWKLKRASHMAKKF